MNKPDRTLSLRTARPKCTFKLPDIENYSCRHPVDYFGTDQSLCVFHIDKSAHTDEKTHQTIAELFMKRISGMISDAHENESEFIDFRGFQFPQITFDPVSFAKFVDFSFAHFHHDIDFSQVLPKRSPEQYYDEVWSKMLVNGANFSNAVFHKDVSFSGCEVNSKIEFDHATFLGKAGFLQVLFKHECSFDHARFEGDASFSNAFLNQSSFVRTKFIGETDFWNFRTGSSHWISSAEFEKDVSFYRAIFGDVVPEISESSALGVDAPEIPESSAVFESTIFHGKLEVVDCHFNGMTSFNGCTFDKQVRFDGTKGWIGNEFSFRGVTLPKDDVVIFEKVNLRKARFHDTDLEQVVFRDVSWGLPRGTFQRLFRNGSYILWDEQRPLEGMQDFLDDAKTAENYRQLVLNYEAKRDYETAEFFHIGEMEMRRKAGGVKIDYDFYSEPPPPDPKHFIKLRKSISNALKFINLQMGFYRVRHFYSSIRKYVNGYGVYWLSSRYGTSYVQAFIVLLFVLGSFSFLFLFSGLKATATNTLDQNRVIEYNVFRGNSDVETSLKKFAGDWGESVLYTLEVVTLQKEKYYEPTSWQSRVLVYPTLGLSAAQLALLLFAIRRRFKR